MLKFILFKKRNWMITFNKSKWNAPKREIEMYFDVINLESSDKNNDWGRIVLKGLILIYFW